MNAIVVKNVAANLLARVWIAGLQLIFSPIYLYLLGAASYGLIGYYASLLVALLFLDQAVSPVLARELSRIGSKAQAAQEAKNLLLTLELLSIATAVALGLALWGLAPYIALNWIGDDSFSYERLTLIVRLIGVAIACQWPAFLFSAGYVGLQRQDVAARLRIIFATVQWGGAALLIWVTDLNVEVFFYWQIISLTLTTIYLRLHLWRIMPQSTQSPTIDISKLRLIWRFAVGSMAVGLTSALLTQADKILVAKYGSLDQLAAYSLCFLMASLLSAIISQPMTASLLPHFSKLMAARDERILSCEYHRWTQFTVVVAFPVTATLIFFPQVFAFIWLPRESLIENTVIELTPWIAAGTLLNIVSSFPYILQVAAGRTRLLLTKNIVVLAFVLPVLSYGLPKFGPIVGAYCWLAINVGYYLFETPLMHRQLLKEELWAWWLRDTLFPGCVVSVIFFISSLAFRDATGWMRVVFAVITGLVAMAMLIALLPEPRAKLTALCFSRKWMT